MPNSYTSVTHKSWGDRIKESFILAALGLCLFFAAFPVLFLNEGRSVYQAQKLEYGKNIVVPINADSVAKGNDGKLVHTSGEATTDETLTDEVLGVKAAETIKLQRVVEMYQWQEEESSETEGHYGGDETTTTTYSYSKEWSDDPIDSSEFYESNEHRNPGSMPISGKEIKAQQVTLGQFSLSEYFIGQMDDYQPLQMPDEEQTQVLEKLSALMEGKKNQTYGDYYYVSEDPAYPQIGDLRIRFKVVLPAIISVVAKQAGTSLDTYTTERDFSLEFYGFSIVDNNIQLFEYGNVTADNMFRHAKQANALMTWIFRLVGLIMMFFGLRMIFGVLETLAAVVPFFGNIIGFFSSLIAFVIAAVLSLITIAIAWLFFRPLLSVILFMIAGGLLYFLRSLRKQPQQEPMMVPETGVPQPMLIPQQGVPQAMVMPQGTQPMPQSAQPVMAQLMPQGAQPVMAQPMPYGAQPVMAQPMPQGAQVVMAQPMPYGTQPVMAQPMPQGAQVVMAQPMPQSAQVVMAQPMVMPQGVQQTGIPQNFKPVQQYGVTTAVTQQNSPMLVPEMAVPQKF